jgi:hypothetical protein
VREKVHTFFAGFADRVIEVVQRCRSVQALADKVTLAASPADVDFILRSV